MIRLAHFTEPAPLWRWPNFKPAELASRGDGSLVLIEEALDALQALRDLLGRPLVVNSAYRDPIYNARIGGAPLSRHKMGDAFDLALSGHDRHTLRQAAAEIGFTGFGHYQTFLHVDLGRRRDWWGGERSKQLWTS